MARTEYQVEITVQSELGIVGPGIVTVESDQWCNLEWALGHAEQIVMPLIGLKSRPKQSFRGWVADTLERPENPYGWGTWNAKKSAYITVTVTPVTIEATEYLGER